MRASQSCCDKAPRCARTAASVAVVRRSLIRVVSGGSSDRRPTTRSVRRGQRARMSDAPAPSHQRTRGGVQTMPLRRRRQRQSRWRPGFPLIRRSRSGTADRAEAREGAGDCPPVACRILTRGRGVGPLVGETEPDFTIRNSPLRLRRWFPEAPARGLSGILLTRHHALRAANAYTFPPPSALRLRRRDQRGSMHIRSGRSVLSTDAFPRKVDAPLTRFVILCARKVSSESLLWRHAKSRQ